MNRQMLSLAAGLLAALACEYVQADLTNTTYQSARSAYGAKHWAEAEHLLRQYLSEDAGYLSAHQDQRLAISNAATYCRVQQEQEQLRLQSMGADAELPRAATPPTLP